MPELTRDKAALVLTVLTCSISLLDVFSGWTLVSLPVVGACLALAALAIVLGARRLRLALICSAIAIMALHLGLHFYLRYENTRWDRISREKAGHALSEVLAGIEERFSDVHGAARRIAGSSDAADLVETDDRRAMFGLLESAGPDERLRAEGRGMLITGPLGAMLAWRGALPGDAGNPYDGLAGGSVEIIRSATHYWIRARVPVGLGITPGPGEATGFGAPIGTGMPPDSGRPVPGWVFAFDRLQSVYPGILDETATATLAEEASARVGHDVRIILGEGIAGEVGVDEGQDVSGPIELPGGGRAGVVLVTPRAFEDEEATMSSHVLFFAALLAVGIIALGSAALFRHLAGPRFERVTSARLALLLAVLAGVRLALSLLRDGLNLGNLAPFTPYYYATQFPGGLLRSPGDLMITGVFAVAGLALLILARLRVRRSAPDTAHSSHADSTSFLVAGLLIGVLAGGTILLGDRIMIRVFSDSAVGLFNLSPFGTASSEIVIRIGLLGLTVGLILLGAVLAGWQMSLLRRYWGGNGISPAVVAVSAVTICLLVGIFVLTGTGWVVLLTATVCLACALVFHRAVLRRTGTGKISLAVGFALAASLIQFPYALNDHLAKRRGAVEAVSVQAVARTDTWKMSVLEQALERISRDRAVGDVLISGRTNLDAYALDLWANSILGKAHVLSGIYILGPSHLELGRFSRQDIGDLSDMEALLREARFVGRPLTSVLRGTSGGREVNLYVGVAPFFRGANYAGSVVVSIPYASRDIAAIATQTYSVFDAVGPAVASPGVPAGEYFASRVSDGRILSTTGSGFEVGKRIAGLEGLNGPAWLEHEVGGGAHASYFVPYPDGQEALLLSFALPSVRERAIRLMAITVGNILVAFLVILVAWLTKALRTALRRLKGRPEGRLRWGFAGKLAAAFVLIAIVPTMILGTASSRFLRSRLREIVEARAAESLNLSRLALDRLVFGDAIRLARNPILLDALEAEPSLLGQMVTQDLKFLGFDIASAVIDAGGDTLATFGNPELPAEVLESVLREGRSYNFFSADDHLVAKAAVPLRDEISPDTITGCAFVSRRLDNGLARQISADLGRDLNFYGNPVVAASSRHDLYVSELVPGVIASSAFLECFVSGRELHFTRERVGEVDLVIGYSPLRDAAGRTVGAMSVPVVFRQDDVGRGMEATSSAISYLLVIVIGAIFIFGLLLARRISGPIQDLTQGTLKIGSGDLSFTIPKSQDDEIGDLVTSFNTMTTALARSRKTLSERKRYIETIIGNVGAGIISTDSRGRIDTFNSAAEKLLGIKARHARGRDVNKVLRRISASSLGAILAEVRGDRGMARKEVVLSRKGGEQVTLRAAATAVKGPRAREMGKVMVFEDVTELIRSKKLVAWSEMARQVAHEIKNPLTPMKLSAQQLLQAHRDGAEDFGSVLEESVATIVEQIESLRRIAVEFSQFSRMPSRELKESDLNTILEECIGQYERTIAGSVGITKSLDPGIPGLMVDSDEVKRVFLNVIENAVQAMPEGGNLEIRSLRDRPRRLRSSYEVVVSSSEGPAKAGREFVEASFADTGSGISAEHAGKLFEPNFSTKSSGTGLGLAICRGIMDAYGGALVIESTEGRGTCVRVRFPVGDRATAPERPAGPDPGKTRRRRSRRQPDRRSTAAKPSRDRKPGSGGPGGISQGRRPRRAGYRRKPGPQRRSG